MWLRSCRRQRVARAEWMLPGAGSPEREQPIVTQLELRAYVPTCLRAYVPTCIRSYWSRVCRLAISCAIAERTSSTSRQPSRAARSRSVR